MVVEHDNVDAARSGALQRLEAGRAAIDADDQPRALADERVDRLGVRPITLEDAIGNVDARDEPERCEHIMKERRGGRAVNVVVAENGDRLARQNSVGEPAGRNMHVGERGWVGKIALQRRRKVCGGILNTDPAPGEHARQTFRRNAALRDCRRDRLAALIEPRAPSASCERARNAEEIAVDRLQRSSGRIPSIDWTMVRCRPRVDCEVRDS